MIKLIIFDAEGILYKGLMKKYNLFLEKFLKKHNSSLSIEEENKFWNEKLYPKALIGKFSHVEANSIWLEKFGLGKELAEEFVKEDEKFFMKNVRIKPYVKETLKKLKQKRYTLAVLSDDVRTNSAKKRLLASLNIDKFFDSIFTSNSIGHMKPEKEAYMYVLNFFRAKIEDSVFVGHSDDEIVGAKNIGLKVICLEEKNSLADFNIKKFSEILEVLEILKIKNQNQNQLTT